jgi:hypothetical protein
MTLKFHILAAAVTGLLVSSVAGAQMRNGSASIPQPSVHARPAARGAANSTGNAGTAVPSVRHANLIQISPSGRATSGFVPFSNSFGFDNTSDVPGLGFDFPHLAAISAGQANNHFSHFGHNGHRGQDSFAPILFGGYPYYYDDLGYDQPEQQAVPQSQPQPQIIVIQQPVPAQQSADSGSDTGNLPASVSAPEADVPIRDVGDFILVRRDGRILFASVFSVNGSQLQYVTPEGIRHTLALSDLDADATQQMNEARGTSVQIRN